MKLKDFIYNKKTKESNLLGVLFVVVVTIVSGAVLYYGFWIWINNSLWKNNQFGKLY